MAIPLEEKANMDAVGLVAEGQTTPLTKLHWRESKWFVLVITTLAIFTDLTVYTVIIPIAPFIVRDLGGGPFETGILIVFFSLGVLSKDHQQTPSATSSNTNIITKQVASPIFGIISDRLQNRRWVLFAGLLGLVVTTIIFAVAKVYWLLAVARFFQGVSGGCTWTVGLAMIADVYPSSEVGVAMSTVMIAFSLGQLIGPPVSGVLFNTSYAAPFIFCYFLIAVDLIGPIIIKDTLKKKNAESVTPDIENIKTVIDQPIAVTNHSDLTGDLADGQLAPSDADDAQTVMLPEKPTKKIIRTEIKYTSWDVLKNRNLLLLFILSVLACAAWGGLEPILPFFLVDSYGFDSTKVGLYFLVPVLPQILCAPVCGYLYDKYGLRAVCLPGSLASAICMACFGILNASNPPYLTAIVLIIYGVTSSFVLTPFMAEIAACIPPSLTARAYGLWNLFFATGLIIGPLTASALYVKIGWQWTTFVQGMMFFICIPGFLIYKRQPLPEYIEEEVDI
ncbi:hypothetical protein SmJEL517_g04510 [Synchytrium microbalum]|uniref:Major facilitator superfamily (MFS) profile domain-containing protein n=1 Tax=Synchytrium microbalum TaxID=1806994 RepID=A0A507BZ10_9FUNG|nr:uncharacterized protein SmJEL517_g04510 [Synchytrium microbalum]TPX32361.1 hypothetical protein SmJEL517_g04510 [Synchytrium microbalum]